MLYSMEHKPQVFVIECQSWRGHLWSHRPVPHLQMEKPAGPWGSQRATPSHLPSPALGPEKVGVAESVSLSQAHTVLEALLVRGRQRAKGLCDLRVGGEGRSPRPREHKPSSSRPPTPSWSQVLGLLGRVTQKVERKCGSLGHSRPTLQFLPCHSSAVTSPYS